MRPNPHDVGQAGKSRCGGLGEWLDCTSGVGFRWVWAPETIHSLAAARLTPSPAIGPLTRILSGRAERARQPRECECIPWGDACGLAQGGHTAE